MLLDIIKKIKNEGLEINVSESKAMMINMMSNGGYVNGDRGKALEKDRRIYIFGRDDK